MIKRNLKVKNEVYKFRKSEGITLISLVITIVVLIILASVAIYLSLGNNGIFTRAKEAKEITNKQQATEIINLKITTAQMNKYADEQRMPTLKELSEVLKKDDEILYVTETSQVASENKKYEVGEKPSSIFTKLDKYPSYEFEINGQLQLASINGVKVATTPNNQQNKISLIYEAQVSNNGEYTLKETIENYDIIVVVGLANIEGTSGHTFILTKGINEEEFIRVGIDDADNYCANIKLKNDKLTILANWNYNIQRIYGIKL